MADYYTEASFIVECSPEQASVAIEALNELQPDVTEYAALVVAKPDDAAFSVKDQLIRFCWFNHPEYSEGHVESNNIFWEFDASVDDSGVWIRPDQSINTEHAAIFTQAILSVFKLDQLVVIEASHTCSKPRLDAYGGHSVVVTKDIIRWSDGQQFIRAERAAHENKEIYYFCEITEINGEYEYISRFLMKCHKHESPEKRLDSIFVNYRDKGSKEGETFVWYPCGLAAKNPVFEEITPQEFSVMQKYLSVV